ncbi:hypothetical protein [Streptomyces canarius]
MADRDTYYGDADVDLDWLLSDDYAASRRELITEEASLEFRPGADRTGAVPTFTPPLMLEGADKDAMAKAGIGDPTVQKSGVNNGDTTPTSTSSRETSSRPRLGGWLQSSPVMPELGFCLGTRLQMVWLDQTAPSALTPGKRPRTAPDSDPDLEGRATGSGNPITRR